MTRPRHAKPDANQPDMVLALRQCGLCVIIVSDLGGDALDLFVGDPVAGQWCQVEVKDEDGTLTASEAEYIARWGDHLPIVVARHPADVLRAMGRGQ